MSSEAHCQPLITWAQTDPNVEIVDFPGASLTYTCGSTHLPLVSNIYVSESVSIGSDNGLSPFRLQAII